MNLSVLGRTCAFMAGICAMTLASGSANAQALKIGTASAAVGEKAQGYVEVPARFGEKEQGYREVPAGSSAGHIEVPPAYDPGMNIPVVVVHGSKPGKTIALVSGAHGTEYSSIIAIEKLINILDPSQLTGNVILVPLINIASFEQKVPHVNPVDNKSMNRFYPGKLDGTQTDRALYVITKEVVDHCDYLIDYHGGDLDESLRPYAYWGAVGNAEQDKISKDMVLAFGLDHIIIWSGRPTDPAASRYLDNTSSLRGKPSIVVEAGYSGVVESDDVALLVNGTLSTMRALKMLPGEPHYIENPVWLSQVVDVLADGPGIFYPLVKRGSYINQGMKIGYITDYFGKTIAEPRAPVSGVVLHVNAVPSLKKGDNIADLGVVATKAPN